jgi:hypothetical protein
LLLATGAAGDAQRTALVDALVGTSQLAPASAPLLAQLDARGPAFHAAVAELLAGETSFSPQTLPLARTAVLDASLGADLRGRLLTALSQMPGDAGRDAAVEVFARLNPRVGAPNAGAAAPAGAPSGAPTAAPAVGGPPGAGGASADPIEAAWRRWVGDRQRAPQLDHFIQVARGGGDAAQRTLAYAVLLQSVRSPRAPAATREKVTPVIESAWSDAAAAPRLVEAIGIMRLESQYADKLQAYRSAAAR